MFKKVQKKPTNKVDLAEAESQIQVESSLHGKLEDGEADVEMRSSEPYLNSKQQKLPPRSNRRGIGLNVSKSNPTSFSVRDEDIQIEEKHTPVQNNQFTTQPNLDFYSTQQSLAEIKDGIPTLHQNIVVLNSDDDMFDEEEDQEMEDVIFKKIKQGSGLDYHQIIQRDVVASNKNQSDFGLIDQYENSKRYQAVVAEFVSENFLDFEKSLEEKITQKEKSINIGEERMKEIEQQLQVCDKEIQESEEKFDVVGEQFMEAKEACDGTHEDDAAAMEEDKRCQSY